MSIDASDDPRIAAQFEKRTQQKAMTYEERVRHQVNLDPSATTIAILREALERIVDEEPDTGAANHYAYLEHGMVCGYHVANGEKCTCGYDRLFAAFALAREALLRAGSSVDTASSPALDKLDSDGMGEEASESYGELLTRHNRELKEWAERFARLPNVTPYEPAPQPEARSCSNCSSRFPSEQDLDDPAHPCRGCRQFDCWTPEAGEGEK